jgi:hypothetical protein
VGKAKRAHPFSVALRIRWARRKSAFAHPTPFARGSLRPGLAHAHGDVKNVPLLRATIDEVADKDDATIGMTEGAVVFAVGM